MSLLKKEPYIYNAIPDFNVSGTMVRTVAIERTFWEKVTILHREANRLEDKTFPARYSRHYYDLYCMANSPVKDAAFANIELLEKVVLFKEKFYRCPWAQYENAKIGTMKLMPPERNLQVLKDDYEHMQNMIFGEKIPFDIILDGIEKLEKEMNERK